MPSRTIAAFLGVSTLATAGAQDTVRVRSTGVGAWGPRVTLAHVMSVGALDGPPEYTFGDINAFAADRYNRFYIFDYKGTQLRAYDANGKFLRSIGQKGAGPGEYGEIAGMGFVDDTVLTVFDVSNARITLFQPSGKVVRTIPRPPLNVVAHDVGVDRSGLI